MEVLQKKIFFKELPYHPAILLLGLYPEEIKSLPQINVCSHMSIAALLTIAKIWKQSECQSMDEYIKTIGCDTHTHTHTHTMGYCSLRRILFH